LPSGGGGTHSPSVAATRPVRSPMATVAAQQQCGLRARPTARPACSQEQQQWRGLLACSQWGPSASDEWGGKGIEKKDWSALFEGLMEGF